MALQSPPAGDLMGSVGHSCHLVADEEKAAHPPEKGNVKLGLGLGLGLQ